MTTPNLELTLLAASQAQKHVTVNEALARLDAAIQLTVIDRTTTAPPAAPADGDRYLIPDTATGAWQGRADALASWDAAVQGWLILDPRPGWRVWVVAEDLLLIHGPGGWHPFAPAAFGVNATADATNRLAVASPAILFNHEGAGVQAKINKASAPETAAFLFQTGYSGRAELGLIGNDDFALKTSPDGSAFTEAMQVPAATARPDFPQGVTLAGGAPLTHFSEGDFTLTLDPGVVSTGQWANATGITVDSARYTRMGRMVNLRAAFKFDGVGGALTGPTARTLRGLPYVPMETSVSNPRDYAGSAVVTGAIASATSAHAVAIINVGDLIYVSFDPPASNAPAAGTLILLDITYEAAP